MKQPTAEELLIGCTGIPDAFDPVVVQRSIVDGQRGYTVTYANKVRVFSFSLAEALRAIMNALGHGYDRELIVMGDGKDEGGNVW